MTTKIDTAMILAAGFGTRMRGLTKDRPKALVTLVGRPLVDWVIERCRIGGIERFVLNAHYKAEVLEDYFRSFDLPVTVLHEDPILETGGGVKNALPLLGDGPFLVANCDSVWLDGVRPAVQRLIEAWDDSRMDALLMLHPTVHAGDYDGSGDFFIEEDGLHLRRRGEGEVAPYLYAGVQILHPRLFDDMPDGAWSLNRAYDKAAEAGRLYGVLHDGEWYHTGSPEQLDHAARIIASGNTSTNTR